MGRLFLVELDIVPGTATKHYRCRNCFLQEYLTENTLYIALNKNRVYKRRFRDNRYAQIRILTHEDQENPIDDDNKKPIHLFTEVVNVIIGQPIYQILLGVIPGIIADVYCNKCNIHLGWKIIDSFNPEYKYLDGVYALDRTMLDCWVDAIRRVSYLLRIQGLFEHTVCE